MEEIIKHENVSNSKELDLNEFYFETDFYLLKSNKDYKNLLKSLAILEVQRCTTIQNLEKLAVLKDCLSKNPSLTLKQILNREEISKLQTVIVHNLPNIDWSVYKIDNETENEQTKQVCDINLRHKNVSDKQETPTVNITELDKSETFKKPWTVEEQLRLEELLIDYPPERNESNRYRKIAEALGTRNLRQVCSRVQKYNMKMKKVGSIKSINVNSKTLNKKIVSLSHKNTGALLKPTTFIPSTTLVDDVDVYDANQNNLNQSHTHTEMNTNTKLAILEEILKDKLSENICPIMIHNNFKCCVCQASPIKGTRWNCTDCPTIGKSSDFCSDCIVDTVKNTVDNLPHPLDHLVIPIRSIQVNEDNVNGLADPNYAPLVFNTQNYLDPNFMM